MMRRPFLMSIAASPLAAATSVPQTQTSALRSGFFREWWYERGLQHGNPSFNNRFRVNAPQVVLHEAFGSRSEVRSSGMMQIFAEEDPRLIDGASLYLELWGGHPHTVNKRVTINGRSTYAIPEVGTAEGSCTHEYPTFTLQRTDLVNGYNALQFACDEGESFWGHFIVENACLRAHLPPQHPALQKAGLAGFAAECATTGPDARGRYRIRLEARPEAPIARVDFHGYYDGYDENGNMLTHDWHGFTKNRTPVAHLGSAASPPYEVAWDTTMLPACAEVNVRAIVKFSTASQLVYESPVLAALRIAHPTGIAVTQHLCSTKPRPFWSRANRKNVAAIAVPVSPSRIQRAQLHVISWDGGRGNIEDYFTFNGKPFPVCGEGKHDVIYSVLDVPPELLLEGENRIELLSDTDHHGIEILEPGPALMLRSRA